MDKREEYDIERSWSLGNELPEDEVLSAEEQIKLSGMLDGIDEWSAQNVEPAASVKTALMAEFKASQTKKSGIWLNGVWFWLFPVDKSWFKAPAFQMLAVAGCAALIFLMVNQIEEKVQQPQLADNTKIDKIKELEKLKESQKSELEKASQPDGATVNSKGEVQDELSIDSDVDMLEEDSDRNRVTEEVSDEENSLKDARDLNFVSLDDEIGNVPAPPDGYSTSATESVFSFNAQTTEKLTGEVDQTITDIVTEKEVSGDELNKVVFNNQASYAEKPMTEINTRSERNSPQTASVAIAEGKDDYKSDKKSARKSKSSDTKSLAAVNEDQSSMLGGAAPGASTNSGKFGDTGTNIASKSISLMQSGDSDLINLMYTAF